MFCAGVSAGAAGPPKAAPPRGGRGAEWSTDGKRINGTRAKRMQPAQGKRSLLLAVELGGVEAHGKCLQP